MKRRRFLSTGAAVGALTGYAGCLGGDDDEDQPDDSDDGDQGVEALPRVENPPKAVYLPSHRDGMMMLETVEAGDFSVSPMLSLPHFFWIWPGPEEVTPPSDDAVHLMATVSDPETDIVLPIDAGSTIELRKDGELVSESAPWMMISQGMGFHFGDNYSIDGTGTYTASISLSPASDVRLTGEFEDRFDERETTTFEFEIDDETRQELAESVEYFDEDRWGDRDAVTPHGQDTREDDHDSHDEQGDDHDSHDTEDADHNHGHHEMPYSSLPPAEDLPGELLGEPTHDDGVYTTTFLDAGSRFVDDGERYLAVSPRTPYNRCVLPQQSLSARLVRDGERIDDEDTENLTATLDHELNFHYGRPIETDLQTGDELVISVNTPPQVSRHQGYETAFTSTGELTIVYGEE